MPAPAYPVEYIAIVIKPWRVLDKLAEMHDGITGWEVDEAVVLTRVVDSWWDYDPDPDAAGD